MRGHNGPDMAGLGRASVKGRYHHCHRWYARLNWLDMIGFCSVLVKQGLEGHNWLDMAELCRVTVEARYIRC